MTGWWVRVWYRSGWWWWRRRRQKFAAARHHGAHQLLPVRAITPGAASRCPKAVEIVFAEHERNFHHKRVGDAQLANACILAGQELNQRLVSCIFVEPSLFCDVVEDKLHACEVQCAVDIS